MTKRGRGNGLRQTTTGLLMMAAGVVLLLDQQGIIEIGSIGHWWPLVLVALGLWKVTGPDGERDVAGGAMFMVFGVWFLACNHHWMGLTFENSWPLVFVVMGVRIIVKALTPRRSAAAAAGVKEDDHA
jgi:hypothetical protein